ncbi:uncharacterized protein CXQ87_000066 [Candidozyma duobushaemuli]|uniref:Knr4/Smi1-like domain-containing protein n=2 Tax=Candidozyma TaxID=3303203 RepID=A0ABX8HZ20_9ASCO|nr:uncharacterized protein CXQ87_000066 [[Candida] duobushaemulonis]PVH17185.1 hypothetical protein CXQ87_000066 [[Candida] duobushaemulonis]QWU85847.1 hypothetical protein CA3LBN_000065 [[Candida] haemuloni]
MGFLDNVKSFWHSVTTDDHYASYGSPYKNSTAGGSIDPTSSTARLADLNNSSSHSLVGSRTASTTNVAGYRPGLRSSSTNLINQSSDVQMQTLNREGLPPLPSIDSLWDRIEKWLEEEYPELEDSLNDGASTADLNEFERDLAIGPLPVEVRQFFKIHDGQFRGGKPTGLIMGLSLLDIESIMEEYAVWAKVAERIEKQVVAVNQRKKLPEESTSASFSNNEKQLNNFLAHQKSVPINAVQSYYIHRGWVPLVKDPCGNLIGLDLAPGPAGLRGQIILYGRDFDTKIVVATSLQEFLFQFITDLELGNYEIDQSESNTDNGFLDSAQNDDYMIGDEDEGNGDLTFLDRDGSEFGTELKGKISYIEALKRRALKRYSIPNAEKFQTAFTPQRVPRKQPMGRPEGSPSKNASTSKLVNLESSVELPKETLIDDSSKSEDKPSPKQEAPKSEETVEAVEAQPEESKAEDEADKKGDEKTSDKQTEIEL